MTSITLHKLDDDLAARLQAAAAQDGLSLNLLIKRTLRSAFGLAPAAGRTAKKARFDSYVGLWTEKEGRAFAAATRRTVDREDWK